MSKAITNSETPRVIKTIECNNKQYNLIVVEKPLGEIVCKRCAFCPTDCSDIPKPTCLKYSPHNEHLNLAKHEDLIYIEAEAMKEKETLMIDAADTVLLQEEESPSTQRSNVGNLEFNTLLELYTYLDAGNIVEYLDKGQATPIFYRLTNDGRRHILSTDAKSWLCSSKVVLDVKYCKKYTHKAWYEDDFCPTICWVSDYYENSKHIPAVIIKYNASFTHNFIATEYPLISWKYATPLTEEELTKLVNHEFEL